MGTIMKAVAAKWTEVKATNRAQAAEAGPLITTAAGAASPTPSAVGITGPAAAATAVGGASLMQAGRDGCASVAGVVEAGVGMPATTTRWPAMVQVPALKQPPPVQPRRLVLELLDSSDDEDERQAGSGQIRQHQGASSGKENRGGLQRGAVGGKSLGPRVGPGSGVGKVVTRPLLPTKI